jgi:hypothetical protein
MGFGLRVGQASSPARPQEATQAGQETCPTRGELAALICVHRRLTIFVHILNPEC